MNNMSNDIEVAVDAAAKYVMDALAAWVVSPNFFSEFVTFIIGVIVFRYVMKMTLWIVRKARKRHQRRMARAFPQNMRVAAFNRAGNQCEFSNGINRCRNRAEHADHFYPFSAGGATSVQNLVAACSGHNLSKGAKIPSMLEKSRIEARRKRYFPAFTSVKAGEWSRKRAVVAV